MPKITLLVNYTAGRPGNLREEKWDRLRGPIPCRESLTGGARHPRLLLLVRFADIGVWTFWREGLRAVSRTIFHRAGDAPRGRLANSAASRTKAGESGLPRAIYFVFYRP
jgi:hypothetical protein